MTNTTDIRNNNEFKSVKELPEKLKSTSKALPHKEYSERNSLLIDLYGNQHITTVYRVVLVTVFIILINNIVYDCLYNEPGVSLLYFLEKCFANFHYAILVWIFMFLSSFIPYYGLVLWATVTIKLPPKSLTRKVWNVTALLLAILHHVLFLIFYPVLKSHYQLPLFTSAFLVCDAVRLSMKTYAFIRSNSARVFQYKPHVEDQILYPTVQQFLFYSFCPGSIYQDNYPRNKTINWSRAVIYGVEFMAGVFLMGLMIKYSFVNNYYDYGLRQFEKREVTLLLLKNWLVGFLMLFDLFYVVLHTWMNLFGELLRFSDRMFYKDWWTSISYDQYHRTWNVPVQDWLYTYVYKDLSDNVFAKNKTIPKLAVLFVSAAFHEYILATTFGFFLPTLFFLAFICNAPLTILKLKSETIGNYLMLGTLGWGIGCNMCAYAMEHYCRVNSPQETITWGYILTPQLLNCIKE